MKAYLVSHRERGQGPAGVTADIDVGTVGVVSQLARLVLGLTAVQRRIQSDRTLDDSRQASKERQAYSG